MNRPLLENYYVLDWLGYGQQKVRNQKLTAKLLSFFLGWSVTSRSKTHRMFQPTTRIVVYKALGSNNNDSVVLLTHSVITTKQHFSTSDQKSFTFGLSPTACRWARRVWEGDVVIFRATAAKRLTLPALHSPFINPSNLSHHFFHPPTQRGNCSGQLSLIVPCHQINPVHYEFLSVGHFNIFFFAMLVSYDYD